MDVEKRAVAAQRERGVCFLLKIWFQGRGKPDIGVDLGGVHKAGRLPGA
jgi:hypothetical protein